MEGNPSWEQSYRNELGVLFLPAMLFVFFPMSVYFTAKKRGPPQPTYAKRADTSLQTLGYQSPAFPAREKQRGRIYGERETLGPLILLFGVNEKATIFPLRRLPSRRRNR